MMPAMKLQAFLVLLPLAACGPSKSESLQAFVAVTGAASSAQSRAVADAQQTPIVAPAQLTLSFSGPCTLGGTVGVTGSYDDASGTGERAAFDLAATFDGCAEATGTIDGDLTWTSVSNGTSFDASMDGSFDFRGAGGGSFSCDFNMDISVDNASSSFAGSFCGYDVKSELGGARD
jgi:hypothetical protein